jgi:hypothetical protein
MENYSVFKSEYPYRDTKRKLQNDLKSDVRELEYRINSVEPQIKAKGYAYLYGEVYRIKELNELKTELKFTNQLLKETL